MHTSIWKWSVNAYTVKIKVLFQPGYRSTQLQLSMISIAYSHDTRYIELSSTSRHSISPSNHPLY